MSDIKECSVCCEERKMIVCNVCEFEACQECIQRYLLESFQDKHCMKCRNGWSNEFVFTNLKPSFLSGVYWKHRKECLFNEEKMRFPEFMRIVELDKTIPILDKKERKYRKRIIDLLMNTDLGKLVLPNYSRYRKQESLYTFFYSSIPTLSMIMPLREEIVVDFGDKDVLKDYYLCLEYAKCFSENSKKLIKLRNERNNEYNRLGGTGQPLGGKNKVYTFPCPREGCLGMINPNTEEKHYTCPVCLDKLCKKCYIPIKDKHKCDKSVVATMKMIMKDSKPCPECKTPISRVSGCPQMWCVACHTAFNYETGEKVKGVVHNPHYFEYLRNRGDRRDREQVRDACGNGIEDITVYTDKLDFEIRKIKSKEKKGGTYPKPYTRYRITIEYYFRLTGDINQSFRDTFSPPNFVTRSNRLNRRIEYLSKVSPLADKQFRTNILRERRDDEIRNFMYTLCTTVYMLLCGAFREYIEEVSVDAYPHFEEKCKEIIKHFNDCSYNERKYMKYNTYYKLEQDDGKYYKMYLLQLDGKKKVGKRGPRVIEPGDVQVDDDEVIEIDDDEL